jgi:hypothetical protein
LESRLGIENTGENDQAASFVLIGGNHAKYCDFVLKTEQDAPPRFASARIHPVFWLYFRRRSQRQNLKEKQ